MKSHLVLFSALLTSFTVMAGVVVPPSPSPIAATATTTPGTDSKTDTKAYVGLNWTLGGSMTPSLVLGVFNTKVKPNGDTTGANLAFHANLAGGFQPGKIKLSYLDGKEDLQGELGLGYDFIKGAPLGFLGLNAPYVALGVDGYLNPGLVPYLTIHSQGKFDRPTGTSTTYSCPTGTFYDAVSDSFLPYTLSGSTCTLVAPATPPAPSPPPA